MTHRVILVGAGRWGSVHARKLAASRDSVLVGVVDPEVERARAAAALVAGAVAAPSLEALERAGVSADAAVVATPIPVLAPTARALLARGVHVLVEKPAATSGVEATDLGRLATSVDRVLAVGFVERFHLPAGANRGEHQRVVIRRAGPRRLGAGPLSLDWLVHDLDLAAHLLGPGLSVVAARPLGGSPGAADAEGLSVRLAGPGGRAARLDVLRGAARTFRRLRADALTVELAAGPLRHVDAEDALSAQWRAFLAAVEGRPAPRLARWRDAAEALARVGEIEALLAGLSGAARAAG